MSTPDIDSVANGAEIDTDTPPEEGSLLVGAVAGIAAMGVSMAARPVLNAVYRSITGHQPPRAEDPSVPFGRALVWTLFSATTGAVLELVVQRVSRRILEPRG
jgi:hypothetical protein